MGLLYVGEGGIVKTSCSVTKLSLIDLKTCNQNQLQLICQVGFQRGGSFGVSSFFCWIFCFSYFTCGVVCFIMSFFFLLLYHLLSEANIDIAYHTKKERSDESLSLVVVSNYIGNSEKHLLGPDGGCVCVINAISVFLRTIFLCCFY